MASVKRILLALAVAACSRSNAEPRPEPATTAVTASPMVLARGVRIDTAPAGDDLAKIVKDEGAKAREAKDGRDLLVYVGAVWCEPCQYFHKAAVAGKLDAEFPNLTLLEFDLDKDKDRLESDGYASAMIPLFTRPNADGRASDRRFEGSIKGDGAVANITPRLRQLLAN